MISLLFDASMALLASFIALRHVRAYWSYIIAGELIAVFGIRIVFNLIYPQFNFLNTNSWDYLYFVCQLTTLVALVFAVSPPSAKRIYAGTAVLALLMGRYGYAQLDFPYQLICGIMDISKVAIIAWGWHCSHHYGRGNRFNRLHIWQK